jgi:hypothetical protein
LEKKKGLVLAVEPKFVAEDVPLVRSRTFVLVLIYELK